MRDHSVPHGTCSIDPISMAIAGVAGLAGGALMGGGGGGSGSSSAPAPAAPTAQPAPSKQPEGSAQGKRSQQSSFIGGVPTAPAPTSGGGGKTLLGA